MFRALSAVPKPIVNTLIFWLQAYLDEFIAHSISAVLDELPLLSPLVPEPLKSVKHYIIGRCSIA
jgi:hypothetical protein